MINLYTDPDKEWEKIENERQIKLNKKKKVKWDNPLQEKYAEITKKYSREFGHHDGSYECEKLLDDMRAFERVFRIMKWRKNK